MIRIKNITKSKFFGTAIILLQQLIALLILVYNRENLSLLFSEKVALVMTLIDTAFIWLATILRQKQGDIFKRIISIISLTIWQYLVSVLTRGTPLFLSSGLQIILLYCYTVEITNLILYGHKQFKDKLDKGLLIIIFVSITSLFVNRILFNFLFLMVFTILHLYPLLVIVLYYRSFRQQISVVRRSLILFSLLLLVILGSELYGEMLDVNQAFNNLGWYLFPLIMSVIYYFKTIHDKLSFVTQRWLGDYKARIELLFLLLILCWVVLIKVLVKEFLLFFIIVDASTLFCLVVISCIFYYLENSKQNFDYENRRLNYFMKSEENMRVEFSNYLHDDVLQNIIAIKNLLSLENSNITHGFIVNELNDLVSGIREEIDTYHSIVPANQTMKENIQSLFDDIVKSRKSNTLLYFNCSDNMVVPSPYGDIVYRFIKELINNAIKYGDGKDIRLSLTIQSDIIIIEESNQVVEKVHSISYGRGLKSFQETLAAFDGDLELQMDTKQFTIRILLPIDWKLCYEDFIN
ncbi:sensor histidine kinase [Streptococcus pyogenes]|uniref:ATP-binding protein n=1 Tax=Streptococcus pyogenes TaxID=1314 RepID=UPI0007C35D18|nr:ATP-binding protein [Streptococcus pyogenes]OAC58276.1 hypothetical protein AWU03_08375 [Streptococcus pyogenes]OAC63922.1 hypothetical protein AWU05_03740 [Streptococcus pyogenes]OAC64767.1 hypothetical protein AWU06_03385 [Streptococcus pyogenes]OAC74200.1 hypothetical protein AWU01_03290 [Streptococcus pyogenes]VHF13101.1 sensor histidine kinase [Streptococcus pyogenes]